MKTSAVFAIASIIAVGVYAGSGTSDSLGIPMFSQEVTAEWPSEAAARSATATIVELDDGERYLWTSRWDDRNSNHGPLTRALNAVGMPTTCYVNGHSSTNYTPLLREIVASGNAIGAHTISHKHMKNLSPMKCFQEIMQCRVELEIDSQSPVVAFATPYGLWNSSVGSNMKICGEALRNAGFLGGAEGAGNSCAKFGLSSNVWVGAYVFDANDKKPDRVAFGKGFRTGIARIDKGGAGLTGPTFALGVHPWQNEQGRADLAAMVKESLAATPGLKTMTMNRYVARRLQFLSSTVEKMAVDGRCATFRVTRPRVCELGAKAPVLVRLSDGRILHVDAPAVEDVPKAFVRSDGELRVSDDRSKFIFYYRNSTGRKQDRVEFILRLPAGYEPGVVRKALVNVESNAAETLVFRSRPPTEPAMLEGVFYAALEVNFPGNRMWAQLVKP